jgi:hypothetical protein
MEPTTDLRQSVARATLEIETEGRSPGGVLITAQGRELAFSGWAEFGAAIDDWRRRSRRSNRSRPGEGRGDDHTPC